MQALLFNGTGDLSALALTERPTPAPKDGEVLVEVKAAGLNPSDVKNVLGFFPAYTTLPRIPGRDFAGIVRQGPPDMIGKKVWGTGLGLGFSQDGAHADFLVLPAEGCAEMPANLSFAQAAACGVPYTTAWDGIRRAKVGAGKSFLVIGGGAVGCAALALGRALGARVAAAVRRPEQATALKTLGYETLLLGAPEKLAEQALALFGGYADVIFETTGGWLPASIPAAAKHGAICVIAPPGMGKLTVDFPVLDFYRRGLTLLGVNTLLHDTFSCAKMLADFSGLFQSGALPPPPAPREMKLPQGLEAYRMVNEGFSKKIVFAWE